MTFHCMIRWAHAVGLGWAWTAGGWALMGFVVGPDARRAALLGAKRRMGDILQAKVMGQAIERCGTTAS